MYHHRYRASRLSHDAGRQPDAALGDHWVGHNGEAAESDGEEGSLGDAAADLADSDAGSEASDLPSSEASDMPEIMAGDPAEAAAADVYVPFHPFPPRLAFEGSKEHCTPVKAGAMTRVLLTVKMIPSRHKVSP